ncbi:hypothetical protein TELCIR_10060 [Teladorsagia circumcincta]|uniref:NR LBD domain-containing protein n=1 Tax=Teladorsagia circumcincta TaxID=45464 RepID=A0A2G9UD56_TELCI|nr:hypothetical protein TELCIR_10060 [Teladorsagia circumcincta]
MGGTLRFFGTLAEVAASPSPTCNPRGPLFMAVRISAEKQMERAHWPKRRNSSADSAVFKDVQLNRDVLSTTVERPNAKKNVSIKTEEDIRTACNRVPVINEIPSNEFLEKLNFFKELPAWKIQIYEIAKWMMNFQEFAELPLEDKVTLFKTSWTLWQKFERLHMTVQIFGERAVNERVIVTSENGAINMDTVQLEMEPFSDHDSESIKRYFQSKTTPCKNELAHS